MINQVHYIDDNLNLLYIPTAKLHVMESFKILVSLGQTDFYRVLSLAVYCKHPQE